MNGWASESFLRGCLEVDELVVTFQRRGGKRVRAVDGVSLRLRRGENVGLVGESGCGKSTLARAIVGLVEPERGSVRFDGREVRRLDSHARRAFRQAVQMIFQDPFGSLNPRLSIGGCLEEVLAIHAGRDGRNASWRREAVAALLRDVGLDPLFARRYPHEASGGQRQRVAIARALAVRPALLIADEPVSALDVSVQAQILGLLKDLQRDRGLGMLLIAHDLAVVRHLCRRVVVMYAGTVLEEGPTEDLFRAPAHPYTETLIASVPDLDDAERDSTWRGSPGASGGEPPPPGDRSAGCPFQPRCARAGPVCRVEKPTRRDLGNGRFSACHFASAPSA